MLPSLFGFFFPEDFCIIGSDSEGVSEAGGGGWLEDPPGGTEDDSAEGCEG